MDADADVDADTTLEFDPVVLQDVYNRASPYIVGAMLDSFTPGLLLMSTTMHDLVAVHSDLITEIPKKVRYYSSNTEAAVEAVAELYSGITILFAERKGGGQLPKIELSNLDPHDGVIEKVVTFFPSMDTVAMFKGHIVLSDATSRQVGGEEYEFQASSINTFTFTCPYAPNSFIEDDDDYHLELKKTQSMTLGAPVFNLSGRVVGTLSAVNDDYNVKFARLAVHLDEAISLLKSNQRNQVHWLMGEAMVMATYF
ncbi:hypothetical protein ACQJBY_050018 [Aegilops geniculata]